MRERLLSAVRGDGAEVEVAPLGTPGQPDSDDTVLAGRFTDNDAAAVARLISEAGGEVVANVDEAWTRPRSEVHRQPWSGLRRQRVHA